VQAPGLQEQGPLSRATTPETEIKIFRPPKEFRNYFSDNEHVGKYSRAAMSLRITK